MGPAISIVGQIYPPHRYAVQRWRLIDVQGALPAAHDYHRMMPVTAYIIASALPDGTPIDRVEDFDPATDYTSW